MDCCQIKEEKETNRANVRKISLFYFYTSIFSFKHDRQMWKKKKLYKESL